MYNEMTSKKKFKKRGDHEGRKGRRGVYLLPNLLTTANLFAGFFSIISSVSGEYEKAAVAVLISWVFDILDGKVARLSNSTSRFGIEYDSLADLVAFGVAPSILMYLWALRGLDQVGWVATFAFVACGALRLARFNVMASNEAKQFFMGLPIPGAAGMVATTVIFIHPINSSPNDYLAFSLMILVFALSFLMVSSLRYSAFKELDFIRTRPIKVALGVVVLLVVVAAQPRLMLFAFLTSYVLSGPSSWLYRQLKARKDEERDQIVEVNEYLDKH